MENKTAAETHPYFFRPDQDIDRRQCKRVVPMQVLSLGMSRTGTACASFPPPFNSHPLIMTPKAMKAALHILGYNDVYHGTDVYSNIRDCDMWTPALRAKYFGVGKPFGRAQFDQLLGHCAAITDGPANSFGPELIDAYPDAKVVLVEREFDAWFKSFNGIIEGVYGKTFLFLQYTDPAWMGRIQKVVSAWVPGQFQAKKADECRRNARSVYEAHYREIREVTPKERLLEYRLGDGWEPLCKFLGKEIPDVPFLKINESAMLKRQLRIVGLKALKRSLKNVGFVIGMLLGAAMGLYWLSVLF